MQRCGRCCVVWCVFDHVIVVFCVRRDCVALPCSNARGAVLMRGSTLVSPGLPHCTTEDSVRRSGRASRLQSEHPWCRLVFRQHNTNMAFETASVGASVRVSSKWCGRARVDHTVSGRNYCGTMRLHKFGVASVDEGARVNAFAFSRGRAVRKTRALRQRAVHGCVLFATCFFLQPPPVCGPIAGATARDPALAAIRCVLNVSVSMTSMAPAGLPDFCATLRGPWCRTA